MRAGSLSFYAEKWRNITHDKEVLRTISGFELPFKNNIYPLQTKEPPQHVLSTKEECDVRVALERLLDIGAIVKATPCEGQFISSIFVVPKPDGSSRLILNLKNLNEYIDSPHFKMEDYRTASKIILKLDYLAKVDLKDAYYLIPIHNMYRKYLRFRFKNELFEYCCMPFGLACAPRAFTKIIRPIVTVLRSKGHRSTVYLDDFLLMGTTKLKCKRNIFDTITLLESLGFIVNTDKSVLEPSKTVEFLGFIYNSDEMTLSLPDKKRVKLRDQINHLRPLTSVKIEVLAQVIGSMIAATPAIAYAMLRTRHLENNKQLGLQACGSYNGKVTLCNQSKGELSWWSERIMTSNNFIRNDVYEHIFDSDASLTGWGCAYNGQVVHGFWTKEETSLHINELELKAVYNGLNTFFRKNTKCQILVRCDSTTAICYINRQGGCKSTANHNIAEVIWTWCEERNIWIFASYINTKDNFIADAASRLLVDDNDFSLDQKTYDKITKRFGAQEIDLFASYATHKCERYISWYPDPKAESVDAFTIKWKDFFYAFPPFNLIDRVLRKVISDKTRGVLVVPLWKCQAWYPMFSSLIVGKQLVIKKGTFCLINPYSGKIHPLSNNLSLVAAVISAQG